MTKSWKHYYTRCLERSDAPLHFAAHSHHPWPDVSFDAHMQVWEDATTQLDHKWGRVFGEIKPALQQDIAALLSLPDPSSIAFGPNTHDFVRRLISCLMTEPGHVPHILTTDSEFYSFARQVDRMEEDGFIRVTRIPTEPFADFEQRFCAAVAAGGHDMVFVSQVFFNSGLVVEGLDRIAASLPDKETLLVFDGYHGFMALPTDLSAVADRAFYMSGGYKYAQGGEGVCFMHCPDGYGTRPLDTGWMAAFGALTGAQDGVPYAPDGDRFTGATYDPSGLYRQAAVLELFRRQGPDVDLATRYCTGLQALFLNGLEALPASPLQGARLLIDPRISGPRCGRFLTFETPDAAQISDALAARGIITDHRAGRIRFGFGIYQDDSDIAQLLTHLAEMADKSAVSAV
ncbi:MAG: aminotransferase class V-fold PLP-dependent enzyme [Alphaproteobacteria bacterium]